METEEEKGISLMVDLEADWIYFHSIRKVGSNVPVCVAVGLKFWIFKSNLTQREPTVRHNKELARTIYFTIPIQQICSFDFQNC